MELDKWKRKALNAMKKGKSANVDFVTTVIPSEICEVILSALGSAQNEDDVKKAFAQTTTPKVEFSEPIIALATSLQKMMEKLEREE